MVWPGAPDLCIEACETPEDPLKVVKAFEEWPEDLEESMEYHDITDDEKKLKALKQLCGKDVKKLRSVHNLLLGWGSEDFWKPPCTNMATPLWFFGQNKEPPLNFGYKLGDPSPFFKTCK